MDRIRAALARMASDHDAAGEHRPSVDQVFSPDQHANALDPFTPVVVGSRGAGKSFWAGVLEQDDTRAFAAAVYPNIGLANVVVRAGYTGLASNVGVSPDVINARIPVGSEFIDGPRFWAAVVVRAARSVCDQSVALKTIAETLAELSDPEISEMELRRLDGLLVDRGQLLLVTFDALDTWSNDWKRSSAITDALFQVVWSLRARKAIRAKVFIRPEQLNDELLTFVEMPKLRSSRVQLEWSMVDLYGLLYWRLAEADGAQNSGFHALAQEYGATIPVDRVTRRREWQLLTDRSLQERVMARLAGQYMGKGNKKGKTYDWPYNHLADSRGEVTPRSFVKLFAEASRYPLQSVDQAISPDGLRHGLREASKVRVDQLVVEYKWVKRALAPLAGLRVPCDASQLYARWTASNTAQLIKTASKDPDTGFLPPSRYREGDDEVQGLANAMERIGVLSYRTDGRLDMPDLFRVAAKMLKKGGVSPTGL